MSYEMDKRVTEAEKILYGKVNPEDGVRAYRLLEEAAAENNGDAYFFLGRCHMGVYYVNNIFGFEEDYAKAVEFFNRGIECGSALAMFGGQRVDFTPRVGSFLAAPYTSWKEVFQVVLDIAASGHPFVKYMVGNAYLYHDAVEMLGIPWADFDKKREKEFHQIAIRWFTEAADDGIGMACRNLGSIYSSGRVGVEKNEKLSQTYTRIGAELGDPVCCLWRAEEYDSNSKKYYDYMKLAALGGDATASAIYGKQCLFGNKYVEADPDLAARLLMDGIDKDKSCAAALGYCYFKGYGKLTPDYNKAYAMMNTMPEEDVSKLGLGEMYVYGLGVNKNFKKGMRLLDKVKKYPQAKEIQSKYKKTLFGWKEL